MPENFYLITVKNMSDSYEGRLILGNPKYFDRFELEDIANSIESHLSIEFQAKLRFRFSHLNELNKILDLFMMALETCHADMAQDIECAKLALVSLSLSSYLWKM